jgi:hypothetical protein
MAPGDRALPRVETPNVHTRYGLRDLLRSALLRSKKLRLTVYPQSGKRYRTTSVFIEKVVNSELYSALYTSVRPKSLAEVISCDDIAQKGDAVFQAYQRQSGIP